MTSLFKLPVGLLAAANCCACFPVRRAGGQIDSPIKARPAFSGRRGSVDAAMGLIGESYARVGLEVFGNRASKNSPKFSALLFAHASDAFQGF